MSGLERVGFIGLGSQGGPMARRIAAAGYPLTLWARRPEALEPFLAFGATAVPDVATLGATCDHVGICVVDDAGVSAIIDQLLPAMRPGSRVVIHSTILPDSCTRLAERCAERGIAFLDAPVSGGGPGAAAGTLTVMCGGLVETYEAARPVLESFGGLIVRMGDVGAGQRAKIVNNALMAANMGLAHAAMQAAAALDLDGAALRALIAASSGRSFGFEVYARLPTPHAFAHGAPLLRKDVGLLMSSLPDDAGAQALSQAATPFLSAACGD
ncbi:NAD(P)-dependent oxidoreductase [Sphingobium sp. AP49]|uniref:NAD(P)-dependent oxidoreductase n=1 Tax=Sphingobium sp. AP49 TaxID=1144307 RepID=UPI00026EE50B|nr:NAD(P)-dependent oxidoreductase [Sphingobium sp. AP49]WHO37981.1 NAD(P)-dependent oxidoreductase [Sphingobium sp. AP49]